MKKIILSLFYTIILLLSFSPIGFTQTYIDSLTAKTTPVTNDLFILSDSADTNNEKKLTYGNLASTILGGNAATATALAADPAGCSAGQYASDIGANGALTCGTPTDTNTNASTICAGTTTYLDGEGNCDDISSVYLGIAANAATASALAANGANCSAGQAPLGVGANGAVESCFDVWTEAENTAAAYLNKAAADLLYQPVDADLTTWAGVTPSANGQSLVASTNYASMRGLLDLEAGTDFYSKSAEDTWRNSVDQTEMGYLDGVTSDIQTQFGGKESSTSNDFDPDRLNGDTTDDNLIDPAIVNGIKDGDYGEIVVSSGVWGIDHPSNSIDATSLDTISNSLTTAGRSLTKTAGQVDADAELYTDTKCIRWENPTDADDFKSIWYAKSAVTITSLWCESDQTVTAMLQVDDGTPADVDSVDLTCDATPPEDASLDGDATVAAGDRLDLDIASVANTPTWVTICFTYTKDD